LASKIEKQYRNTRENAKKAGNPWNIKRITRKRKAIESLTHYCKEIDCSCIKCVTSEVAENNGVLEPQTQYIENNHSHISEEEHEPDIESTFEPIGRKKSKPKKTVLNAIPLIANNLRDDVKTNLKKLFDNFPEVKSYEGVMIFWRKYFLIDFDSNDFL
jgi:hydroxypyruvate isomerase